MIHEFETVLPTPALRCSEEAVARMVGQRPRLTGGHVSVPAEVSEAYLDSDGNVRITLQVDDSHDLFLNLKEML